MQSHVRVHTALTNFTSISLSCGYTVKLPMIQWPWQTSAKTVLLFLQNMGKYDKSHLRMPYTSSQSPVRALSTVLIGVPPLVHIPRLHNQASGCTGSFPLSLSPTLPAVMSFGVWKPASLMPNT